MEDSYGRWRRLKKVVQYLLVSGIFIFAFVLVVVIGLGIPTAGFSILVFAINVALNLGFSYPMLSFYKIVAIGFIANILREFISLIIGNKDN